MLAIAALVLPPNAIERGAGAARAPVNGAKRTAAIMVTVGKTEDVRIDAPFTDVTVGDPEVADVTPLTDRALSILGKKIGTTRVTIYGEGKRLVGLFDIEVSYDVSRLSAELAPHHRRRHQGVVGQRPHHAVGHLARRGDAGQGGGHRAPVRARHHQRRAGAAAAAGDAGGALHRSQPPGRPRARYSVEHLRPEHADQYRFAGAGQPTARHPPGRTVPTAAPDDQRPGRSGRRQEHPRQPAADLADRRRRRVRDAGGAVRLPARHHEHGRALDRRRHQCARGEGPDPQPGRAQPGRAVGRHRKLPGRRRIPDSGAGRARHRRPSNTRSTASASPSPRPCCGTG